MVELAVKQDVVGAESSIEEIDGAKPSTEKDEESRLSLNIVSFNFLVYVSVTFYHVLFS